LLGLEIDCCWLGLEIDCCWLGLEIDCLWLGLEMIGDDECESTFLLDPSKFT
jgi:hypothetical protein